jgi:hypothetical protein
VVIIAGIIIVIDFARNILIGLSHSQFALGNVVGNILGIIIFFPALSNTSPAVAGHSVLLAIALVASYGIGIYFYFRSGWQATKCD